MGPSSLIVNTDVCQVLCDPVTLRASFYDPCLTEEDLNRSLRESGSRFYDPLSFSAPAFFHLQVVIWNIPERW